MSYLTIYSETFNQNQIILVLYYSCPIFRLVMVLAAVCTVDASHANEQLTARYRFLTGTTHAYIQHLLSNLQPKLEGTSSATQYLSKVILITFNTYI